MPEGVRSRAAGEGWPGGREFSPAAISGNVRFHGSIWNAPLRRRGGFYIRPCNLGQRKTSRASIARPYNALFRQSEAALRGELKGAFTPWPPLRGGSARRRWGRELYGCPKYFGLWQGSLPPPLRGTAPLLALCATSPVSGESVSQREAFRHAGLPSRGATILGGSPQRLPFEGSSRAAGEGGPGCREFSPHHPTSSPHKNHKTQNRGMP